MSHTGLSYNQDFSNLLNVYLSNNQSVNDHVQQFLENKFKKTKDLEEEEEEEEEEDEGMDQELDKKVTHDHTNTVHQSFHFHSEYQEINVANDTTHESSKSSDIFMQLFTNRTQTLDQYKHHFEILLEDAKVSGEKLINVHTNKISRLFDTMLTIIFYLCDEDEDNLLSEIEFAVLLKKFNQPPLPSQTFLLLRNYVEVNTFGYLTLKGYKQFVLLDQHSYHQQRDYKSWIHAGFNVPIELFPEPPSFSMSCEYLMFRNEYLLDPYSRIPTPLMRRLCKEILYEHDVDEDYALSLEEFSAFNSLIKMEPIDTGHFYNLTKTFGCDKNGHLTMEGFINYLCFDKNITPAQQRQRFLYCGYDIPECLFPPSISALITQHQQQFPYYIQQQNNPNPFSTANQNPSFYNQSAQSTAPFPSHNQPQKHHQILQQVRQHTQLSQSLPALQSLSQHQHQQNQHQHQQQQQQQQHHSMSTPGYSNFMG